MTLRYRQEYSYRIRRKTATPEATFSVFLFLLFHFHLFTMNVTRDLLLRAIKGEAGAIYKKKKREGDERRRGEPNTHTSFEETWDPFPLSKACNPYYEHSGVRQHDPSSHWT
jgi:hypothetical protein